MEDRGESLRAPTVTPPVAAILGRYSDTFIALTVKWLTMIPSPLNPRARALCGGGWGGYMMWDS